MEVELAGAPGWSQLSRDLIEVIFSKLPLRSLVRSAAVCRHWRTVVTDPSFPSPHRRRPWFFIYGHNNVSPHLNQAFAFDPDDSAAAWVPLRLPLCPPDYFSGSGGFFLATTSSSSLLVSPLPRSHLFHPTPPLSFPRSNPLVSVFAPGPKLLVVGGARLIGGLVDIEAPLATEIFDPSTDPSSWQLCPPLPHDFRSGNSSQWLSSALVSGRHFFVHGIYSSLISSFDLHLRSWSPVRLLRPPGVLFSFLLPSRSSTLLLAALATNPDASPSLFIWSVDSTSLAFDRIGAMPPEMLSQLFDGGADDDSRFASLKCVGLDGLVYVFNEDHSKAYPAAYCQVDGSTCTWRLVPSLPFPVNRFHKVIAFCSPVPLASLFPNFSLI
ncbi:F-box/kelch-repeat protein At3g24760-like [Dioscorea cayenensis subsp. rotundata]|uniref:F-box/kelch-repeat protein At3g24760-like n=1 Tax=Dioscorea cayennensis subsp. rotundata TaxID=55577 RepID=A0AB40BP58_DIOCR|nr:F-box/kelch-repeat protein At3g24760-like [Dioscorea cayenensis subsp. rotundata]